jgi:2-haloacid dehalogenase
MLIAVHPWDCHGAKAAGLRSLYLNRHDVDFPDYFIKPDFAIKSLTELDSLPLS